MPSYRSNRYKSNILSRTIKAFFFFNYIVSITGLFLYLLFPSAAVERYMVSWVARSYPSIQLSISRLQPNLPLGLSIASSLLLFQGMPLIRADTIQLNPQLDSLFGPQKRIVFQGKTSGGLFNGTIRFAKGAPGFQTQVNAGLTGIRIEKTPFFQQLNVRGLSGVCDARIQSGFNGSASVQLNISECKGTFPSSILSADSILGTESLSFQRVMANLDYRKGELEIKETLFEGPGIYGSLSGVAIVKKPFSRSLLKLIGKISTDRRLAAGSDDPASIQLMSERNLSSAEVVFQIKGTLENPVFSFPG